MLKKGFFQTLIIILFLCSCGGNPANEMDFTPTISNNNNDTGNSNDTSNEQSEAFENTKSLKVLSYNVQAIPCFKNKSLFQKLIIKIYGRRCPVDNWYTRNSLKRVKAIKKKINNMGKRAPDIILFQEVFFSRSGLFEDKAQNELVNIPGYPYVAIGPSSKNMNLDFSFSKITLKDILNSGLLIVSKYPLSHYTNHMYYTKCDLNDCNSSKGAMQVNLKLPGIQNLSIDITNTHMQADKKRKYDRIRIDQLKELNYFYNRVKSNSIQILGGDMNFRFNSDYQSDNFFERTFINFKDSFKECSTFQNCSFTNYTNTNEKKGHILDHIFYHQRSNDVQVKLIKAGTLNFKIGSKQLSDHKPVYSILDISW